MTTTDKAKGLPEWPARDDELHERFKDWWCLMDRDLVLEYERAMKEAYAARLRVAVGEMRHLVAMVGGCDCHESYKCRNLTDPTCVYHNYEIEDVEVALAAIGELPPASTEEPNNG